MNICIQIIIAKINNNFPENPVIMNGGIITHPVSFGFFASYKAMSLKRAATWVPAKEGEGVCGDGDFLKQPHAYPI